jgi:hypothetical protein
MGSCKLIIPVLSFGAKSQKSKTLETHTHTGKAIPRVAISVISLFRGFRKKDGNRGSAYAYTLLTNVKFAKVFISYRYYRRNSY